jgi:hypothetical protein
MKKSGIIIVFIVSFIILLSIVQAILSNTLSTSGVLMSKINKELQAYKTENAEIREKLFSQASLTNVASRASELGFAKAGSQFVLTVSDAILTTSSLAIRQ